MFAIDNGGYITTTALLDHEATAQHVLTVQVTDGAGLADTATVTVNVNDVNEAPVAMDDTASTDEDNEVTVPAPGVLDDDTDDDAGDAKTVAKVNGVAADVGTQITLASGALLTINADGSFTYDPNGQFEFLQAGDEANDGFDYTVEDSQGASDSATVSITIQGVDDTLPAEAEIVGMVWEDFNHDGDVNFGERAIEGVTVELTGVDSRGNPVSAVTQTGAQGIYMFFDLPAGVYTLTETQPAGFEDGSDTLGTVDEAVVGDGSVNDQFSQIVLTATSIAENYNFGELPAAGGSVVAGQTATIGYWQNKNGQALIRALNGGETATQLSSWLAASFANMYGGNAGANDLSGMSNDAVADFYRDLFRRKKKESEQLGLGGPVKTDAQVMATALAVYVTNETLAGTVASSFGFLVTAGGVGVATINVGDNGSAFGVADDIDIAVLDLLFAVNDNSYNGILYDLDHDGDADDSLEAAMRVMVNEVFTAINEQGDI